MAPTGAVEIEEGPKGAVPLESPAGGPRGAVPLDATTSGPKGAIPFAAPNIDSDPGTTDPLLSRFHPSDRQLLTQQGYQPGQHDPYFSRFSPDKQAIMLRSGYKFTAQSGRAGQFGQSVEKGFLGGVRDIADAAPLYISSTVQNPNILPNAAQQNARIASENADYKAGLDRQHPTEPTLTNTIGHAIGGTAPIAAAGIVAPEIIPTLGAAQGFSSSSSQVANRTDLSDDQKRQYAFGGAGIGYVAGKARIPGGSAVGGAIERAAAPVAGETAARIAGAVGGHALTGGTLGAASQVADNALSRGTRVDPNRTALQGVPEAAISQAAAGVAYALPGEVAAARNSTAEHPVAQVAKSLRETADGAAQRDTQRPSEVPEEARDLPPAPNTKEAETPSPPAEEPHRESSPRGAVPIPESDLNNINLDAGEPWIHKAVERETAQAEQRRARWLGMKDEDVRSLPGSGVKQAAEDLGVHYDTPSLTIPRILDAREAASFQTMSSKELWDTVRGLGLHAGTREQNVEALIQHARDGMGETPVQTPTPAEPGEPTQNITENITKPAIPEPPPGFVPEKAPEQPPTPPKPQESAPADKTENTGEVSSEAGAGRMRPKGAVALPDKSDLARAGALASAAADKVRRAIDPQIVPELFKAGVGPEAVAHAKALDQPEPIAKDLMAKVLPDGYKDPAQREALGKVLVADQIISGYRAAVAAGDKEATAAINARHDVKALQKQVATAVFDKTLGPALKRWKEIVNPLQDELYNKMKRLDPATPAPQRGAMTGARMNLIDVNHLPKWMEAMNSDEKPIPSNLEGNASSYRNPDVRRDKFDRSASYLGEYATDPQQVLKAMLAHRLNETTKHDLYNALVKKGKAQWQEPGTPGPEKIGGKDAVRLSVDVPVTNPDTNKTTMESRNLFVQKGLEGEIRNVLNTDMRTQNRAVQITAGILNKLQMAGLGDAAFHTANVVHVAGHAQVGNSVVDVIRKMPFVGTLEGASRILKTMHDVRSDTPEIRAEVRKLSEDGGSRGYYKHAGWKPLGNMVEAVDLAARLEMNRRYDSLVEKGLAVGTKEDRIQFLSQVGEYNRRLQGPLTKFLKDAGLSPFIVAGHTMNMMGRRALLGTPGFKSSTTPGAIRARTIGLSTIVSGTTMAMLANYMITGKVGGRDGTPLGAIDTGKDDENGNHRTIDLFADTMIRRGLRSTGANAAIEGVRQGKNRDQILGNAFQDVMQSQLHPLIGPAPAFAFKTATGIQPDLRGKMEATKIPSAAPYGPRQLTENARAAAESSIPLIYHLANLTGHAAGIGLPADHGYGETLASDTKDLAYNGAGKTLGSVAGIGTARPATNAAETLAENFAHAKFSGGGMTEKEQKTIETKRPILRELRNNPEAGKKELGAAVAAGDLTHRQAAALERKAGLSPFASNVKALEPDEAVSVWKESTPQQRDEIRDVVRDKIIKSDRSPEKQDALLKEAGIEPPPELPLDRAYHALSSRASRITQLTGELEQVDRRIEAAKKNGDTAAVAKLGTEQNSIMSDGRKAWLSDEEREDMAQLEGYRKMIKEVREGVEAGKYDGKAVEESIRRGVEKIMAGRKKAA